MESKETKIEYIGEQSSLDDLRKRIDDLEMNLGVLSPRNLAGIRRKDLRYATMPYLFGTGADGDLLLNSGTTTIDLQSANLLIKNYKNLKITGDAKLQFSNPPDNGSIIIFNVLDTFELSSSSDPGIDLKGIGSKGGFWTYSSSVWSKTDAKPPFSIFMDPVTSFAGSGSNGQSGGGGGGTACDSMQNGHLRSILAAYFDPFFLNSGINVVCTGSGGGCSGCYNTGQPQSSGLDTVIGGRGAGTIIIRCRKLIFTGKIDASGINGSNAVSYSDGSYTYAGSGGAGGGSGGGVFIIYNDLISNSGEINVNGGSGGNGVCSSYTAIYPGGGAGGTFYLFAKGGNGLAYNYTNTYAQSGQNGLTGGSGGSGGFSPNCQSVSGAGGGGGAGEKLIIQNTIKF